MAEDKPHRRTVAHKGGAQSPALPFHKPEEEHFGETLGQASGARGPTLPFKRSAVAPTPAPAAQPTPGAPWSVEVLPDLAVPMGARTKSARSARRSIVPVHHAASLSAVAFPWTVPEGVVLVIVAKATATISADGDVQIHEQALALEKDVFTARALSGRSLEQERSLAYASDYAVRKRLADVTAVGHAYAPGGHGPAARASFRFGHDGNSFERHIAVFGDRQWERGMLGTAATSPTPFKRLPLVYERAYGGDGFVDNPVGVGVQGDRLPNLEAPSRLIAQPSDRAPVMGFGPIAKHWGIDAPALPAHADFPEGFDWDRFQQAPVGQRLAELRGDEPFSFAAMHPDKPLISGRLPSRQARCVLTSVHAESRRLVLDLDTVAFDLDRMLLSLVWRACFPISHPRAPEVASVTLGLAPSSAVERNR